GLAHGADDAEATDALTRAHGSERHDVALVLGSGWADAAASLGETEHELPFEELPGFVAPSAVGHGRTVRSVAVGAKRALVFLGRVHLYEGLGVAPVVHPVRTAVFAGCRTVILTNACGAVARHQPRRGPERREDRPRRGARAGARRGSRARRAAFRADPGHLSYPVADRSRGRVDRFRRTAGTSGTPRRKD